MTLHEIGVVTGCDLEFGKRDKTFPCSCRVYVSFGRLEVKDGCLLESPSGDGVNRKYAKQDYAKQLRGKLVVVDAMLESRREYQLPKTVTA